MLVKQEADGDGGGPSGAGHTHPIDVIDLEGSEDDKGGVKRLQPLECEWIANLSLQTGGSDNVLTIVGPGKSQEVG